MKYKLQNENDLMRTYVFDNASSEPKQRQPDAKGKKPSKSAGAAKHTGGNGGNGAGSGTNGQVTSSASAGVAGRAAASGAKSSGVSAVGAHGSGSRVGSRRNVKRGSAVRTPDAAKRTKVTVHTVKSTERKKFPIGIVFSALACTAIFMVMLWSYVQINEETQRIETLEYQLKAAVKEETELTLKLEEKNNLKTIEEYAKTQLGMVQIDQLAKKYISVASADKIELVNSEDAVPDDDEPGFFETLKEAFEEKLGMLLEYFS